MQRTPYCKTVGYLMAARFREDIQKKVLKLLGRCCLADDFYIHLPAKVELDVIDEKSGKPKLRHITVWRLTYDMKVVDGHGEEYLPDLLRVFDWERILVSIERNEQRKKETDSGSKGSRQ